MNIRVEPTEIQTTKMDDSITNVEDNDEHEVNCSVIKCKFKYCMFILSTVFIECAANYKFEI